MRSAEGHDLKGNTAKLLLTDGRRWNIYHLGAASRLTSPSSSSAELAWLCKGGGGGGGGGGGQRPAQSQREGGQRPDQTRVQQVLDFLRSGCGCVGAESGCCSAVQQHVPLRRTTVKGENKPSHLTPDLHGICPLRPRFHQFVSICSLCIYTPSISDCLNSKKG